LVVGVTGTDIAATRAYFAPRAAGWDERFPDDAASYRRAVSELAPPRGGTALDAACGTGRALSALRDAVGPDGLVLGVDVTTEMLREAARRGRGKPTSALILADVTRLPIAVESVDAVLAAGLVSHLPDVVGGLRELARVCRPGARLALFHPIGRAALASRKGHALDPDDVRSEAHIRRALDQAGWHAESVDDADERYLVLAVRT
jgi:SAM-dependent methyltransferase